MPFDSMGVYKLSDVNQNYIGAAQIAMAPRRVQAADANEEEWQYLGANDVVLGHTIVGKPIDGDAGVIEIEDQNRKGRNAQPVVWRFEPLTLELWNEMGEAGEISGWEELQKDIKDDDSLVDFYRTHWVEPQLDWWPPPDKTEESVPASKSDKSDE